MIRNKKGSTVITTLITFAFLALTAAISIIIAVSHANLQTKHTEISYSLYESELKSTTEFYGLLNSRMSWDEICVYFDNNYPDRYYFRVYGTEENQVECGSEPASEFVEERTILPGEDKSEITVILRTW